MNILSFGGGVDSSTLLVIDLHREESARLLGISREDLDRVFPSPDKVVFSDTGAESAATYRNIERFASLLGDRFAVVRKDGESITEWCLRLGSVPVMPGGGHVCSLKFKGQVMQKWAKQFPGDITWQIGIEADEGRRAKRFTPPKGDRNSYVYPLMDLGLTREKCLRVLAYFGFQDVEKSSCVFCPFKTEDELRDMYLNDRESWDLCERLEDRFQEASGEKHQAWIDAGRPLNKAGRAPTGMWRKDSYAEGARLFAKRVQGRQLSVREWAARFDSDLIAAAA